MVKDIWDEKPSHRDHYVGVSQEGYCYSKDKMDAWLKKLKAHYEAKNCMTCKHLSYTNLRESYCGKTGFTVSVEHVCSHWEDEG